MRSSFSELRRSSSQQQQRRSSDQASLHGGAASSSDIASIITSPGHALHLADVRLSLSSVVLSAQTTLQAATRLTSPLSAPASNPPISFPAPTATAATNGISRRLSLFESAGQSSASTAPPSANATARKLGGKLRPRSADIGARARDALLDLGRAARELRGSRQRTGQEDVQQDQASAAGATTTTEEAAPLEAEAQVRQARAAAAAALEGRSPTRSTPVVRVRRVLRLRPRVSALLQPARQGAIPTQILSRLEASDDGVGLWERLDAPPAELVADEEPALRLRARGSMVDHAATSGGVGRAGNFYPSVGASDSEDDAAYSEDDDEADEEEEDALDPTKMLLKLASPATAARQRWTTRVPDSLAEQGQLLETHEVRVRVRLRLQPPFGQATPTQQQQNSPHKRTASGTRVTKRPGSSGGRAARQLYFVAAHSSAVLLRALGSSASLRDEASAREAGLLARVLVPEAGEREQDFEWGFHVTPPSSTHAGFASTTPNAGGKRACAFVERDERGNVTLLASFAFFTEPPTAAVSMTRQNVTLARPPPPIVMLQAPDSRRQSSLDVPAPFAGRNAAPRFGSQSSTNTQPFPTSPTSVRVQLPSISGSSTFDDGSVSSSKALEVDHTEISLAEVASDSPVFRAALQSLDRRTATLRRAAKAALRAAATQTQLVNARAAHVALDECLADLAPCAHATLGALHGSFLSAAFKKQREGDEEEARMLDECLAAPLRDVLERCRMAQEQSKVFEAESRTYYSQTKQWLSSRSAPAAGAGEETAYAPTAVGFDKHTSKQERNDEKQRLRQAKFDRARLEAYRAATALHGGEAELELARSVLALCLWHAQGTGVNAEAAGASWPTEEARSMLASFGEQIQAASARVEERDAVAREKAAEIESLIARLESGLVREGEVAQAGDTSWMLVGGVNLTDSEAFGAATRQAGHKIKHILSSIGGIGSTTTSQTTQSGAIVPSISMASTMGGDSAPDDELLVPQETPTRATSSSAATAAGLRKKVSLKLSSSNTASPVFGALQRLRGANAPTEAPSDATSPQQLTKLPPLSPYGEHFLASSNNKASPSPRRALSQASPRLSQAMLDYSAGRMPSPRTTDRQSPTMHRSSSDVARPAFLQQQQHGSATAAEQHTTPVRSASSGLGIGGVTFGTSPDQASPLARTAARFGDVRPAVTASMERKKEGLLWVLSKPIQGAGGADAPRGVNRSAAWREAWVVLSGSGMLGEYAAWRESKILEPSQPLIDLRFATVREGRGVERRFTFEVVTRDSRRFFQAPDEATMREWIGAIQKAIESLLNGTSSVRQIDKVARSSDYASPSFGAGDDFAMMGSGAGLRAFGASPVPIGQSKAFSQSLTDLSSVASARLFNRQSDSHRNAKRDSRTGVTSPSLAAHLTTLSEASSAKGILPVTPTRPSHERGISNRTPVSGYVLNEGAGASSSNLPSALRNHAHLARKHGGGEASEAGTSASSEVESDEFDARIAELVQSSYGGSTTDLSGGSAGSNSNPAAVVAQHRRSSTLDSSPAMSRQTSSAASSGQGKVRMRVERINSASSTKISRAAEVARISRLPENAKCADCRSSDPRWASWALNGQPCCIFICIACSGVHRSLGVQVSKVKSVDLDDWTVEQTEAARAWGNERVNAYYEHARPSEGGPSPHFTRDKTFWMDKYVHRKWAKEGSLMPDEVGPASPNGSAGARLRPATRRSSSSYYASQAVREEGEEEASRSTRDSTPKAMSNIAPPMRHDSAISTSPTTFVSLLSSHLGPPTLDTRPTADYLPPVLSPSSNSSTSSVSVVTASPVFNAAPSVVAPSTPSRSRTRSHSTPHHSPAATALQAAR